MDRNTGELKYHSPILTGKHASKHGTDATLEACHCCTTPCNLIRLLLQVLTNCTDLQQMSPSNWMWMGEVLASDPLLRESDHGGACLSNSASSKHRCMHGCMQCKLHLNASHTCRKNGCRVQASGSSLDSPLKCARTHFGLCERWICSSASRSQSFFDLLKASTSGRDARTPPSYLQISNVQWQDRVCATIMDCSCHCQISPCGLSWCEVSMKCA